MKEFKKGDKVNILRSSYNNCSEVPELHVGKVATVHAVNGGCIMLYAKHSNNNSGGGYTFWKEELELVTETKEETKMEFKFKVGDKVVITNRSSFNGVLKVGDEGTITKLPISASANYSIDFPGVGGQVSGGDDIKLVDSLLAVGTKVRMSAIGKKEYPYNTIANPHDNEGNVLRNTNSGSHIYEVRWSTGNTNSYRLNEIEAVVVDTKDLVGYEVIAALPGIPVGTKSETITAASGITLYKFVNGDIRNAFTAAQVADTKFFKAIYKPKEVVIKISGNRTVKIEGNNAVINGEGSIKLEDVKSLYQTVTSSVRLSGYKVSVTDATYAIGCQTVTKADIEAVYTAIKDIK